VKRKRPHHLVAQDKTRVRTSLGAPTKTHLELRDIAVEEFLEMLRFDQRDRLAELPPRTVTREFEMRALNTQIPTNLSTEQVIVNHVSVEAVTEISGYNAQYLRRLLRAGKLDGIKVGQVWLIDLASLQTYFSYSLSSNDVRCGPKGVWQPPF
jgi:hypothetical protein